MSTFPKVIDVSTFGQNNDPALTPPVSVELVSRFGHMGDPVVIPPVNKGDIHYAVEVDTGLSTIPDNHTYGFVGGKFRFVTDRPKYDGTTVIPKYGSSEINVIGTDVSGTFITDIFFEDFLLKEAISGNPTRSIDFASSCSYGNNSSFSFQIRGDKISGLAFWKFCSTQNIYLINAIVRVWIVIDDVFFQCWRGRVSGTPYSEDYFEFDCADDANTIHKIVPPKQETITTNTQTGVSQVKILDSTGKVQAVVPQNIVISSPAITTSNVTVPVVLGDVCYSPVIKLTDVNTFKQLSYVPYQLYGTTTEFPACPASEYILAAGANPTTSSIDLLTFGKTYASGELIGQYLQVIKGQNADSNKLYKITGNDATISEVMPNYGDQSMQLTLVHIDSLLTDSNKNLVTISQFGSNDGSSDHNRYAYWWYAASYLENPHASPNTWWFKISPFTIDTNVSNDTSINMQKNQLGKLNLWAYDSSLDSYNDLSTIASLLSTGNSLIVTANTAYIDGKVPVYERIVFPVLEFGLEKDMGVNGSIISPTDTQGAYRVGVKQYYVQPHDADIISRITDMSRLPTKTGGIFSFPPTSGDNDVFLYVNYKITASIALYDEIMFLADISITSTIANTYLQPMPLTYSLFDSNIFAVYPYGFPNGFPSPQNNVAATYLIPTGSTGLSFNTIPDVLYASDKILNDLNYLNSDTLLTNTGYVGTPFSQYFNFDKVNGGNKSDLFNTDYESMIQCRFRLRCSNTLNLQMNTTWQNMVLHVKQVALVGQRSIDTIKADLYTTLQGETVVSSTDTGAQTNNVYDAFVHLLEDYDGLQKTLIDYGTMSATDNTGRKGWHLGRTLTEQQNNIQNITDLSSQSWVNIYTNRKGQVALRPFDSATGLPLTPSDISTAPIHDETVIVDKSITSFDKTDISQMYNSFNVKYNYKAGINDYTKSFYIAGLDGLLTGGAVFPAIKTQENGVALWLQFVNGLQDTPANYTAASIVWNACFSAYQKNKVIQQAQDDLQSMSYFIDRADFLALAPNAGNFNNSATGGSGLDSSAWKALSIASTWSTKQKYVVQYSVPITTATVLHDLLDCINFKDNIYTDSAFRTAWINSIEVDAKNDQFKITAILQPITGQD